MSLKEMAGTHIEFDEDGYMIEMTQWNEGIAAMLAEEEGIYVLTDRHWDVIKYMRKEFEENGDAPSIRRLTKQSSVATKELYQLFPGGPAKKAARIAGLKKPRGCI